MNPRAARENLISSSGSTNIECAGREAGSYKETRRKDDPQGVQSLLFQFKIFFLFLLSSTNFKDISL
jgi:hypothetical protein